ncbi:MAG: VC0807 family protein [Thermoflexales bacterium]
MKSPLVKLILDIVMGAAVPILILNNLTPVIGPPPAYVFAALVPVGYVLVDTLVISRRFNAITTYVALTTIMQGVLAFWFVDGWRYALKDTAGLIVAVLIFFGSLALGKPMMLFFLAQVFQPDTPRKYAAMDALLRKPRVWRVVQATTALIGVQNLAFAVVNFSLNLSIVTASFGSSAFNSQVAQVNGITRVAFTLISFAVFVLAFFWLYSTIYRSFPPQEGKDLTEVDIWDLLRGEGLLVEEAQAG